MEKANRSKTYLLPMVLEGIEVNTPAIVNTYVYNTTDVKTLELNQDAVEGLFIKLKYSEETKDTFKFNSRCKYIKDIDDKHFIVFFEALPTRFVDMKLIIESKYSKINLSAKVLIINFCNIRDGNPIKSILERDEKYRLKLEADLDVKIAIDVELGNLFELEKEVYG